MSSLLDQFLAESRDLLEKASQGLLALEQAPDDASVLNDLFRSVHTMKGASGLFEIAPFTAVVHAAEDLLDAVRDGRCALSPAMTDVFLEALDRIAGWLDDLEARASGDDAAAISTELCGRLRGFLAGGDRTPPAWLADVPPETRRALAADRAGGTVLCALEYTPHEDAFFSGDDPLFTVLQLPGRRWLAIEPVRPWPAPEELDPFRCNLRFRAILAAERAALAHQLR